MQLDNALNLTVRQVGHRDIIAIQKGKTFIVILKVKRFPHTRGQLVNKTEHAMVSTTVLFITKVCFEIAAERLIFPFFNRNLLLCTILADRQSEMRRRGIELIVQCIVQGVTINSVQPGSKPKRCAGECSSTLTRCSGIVAAPFRQNKKWG